MPPRPVDEQDPADRQVHVRRHLPQHAKTRVLAVRPMHPCAIALVEDSHAHP